jgi:hypothetical protein
MRVMSDPFVPTGTLSFFLVTVGPLAIAFEHLFE